MRLTLRTLLAYQDDILQPPQAKALGEKIQSSTYASSLVSRIHDVLRRRRISAPEVLGPGSSPDPNLVAEYLDNTLAPERIADLERICLESDAHLAEVAACHQILTLVLGEPVSIPQGMRERMYTIGAVAVAPESNGDADAVSVPLKTPPVRPAEPQPAIGAMSDRSAPATTLPPVLARRSQWKSWLPYLAGVGILALWGYLMISDSALKEQFVPRALPLSEEVDLSAGEGKGQRRGPAPVDVAAAGPGRQAAAPESASPAAVPLPDTSAVVATEDPPVREPAPASVTPPTPGEVTPAIAVGTPETPPPADLPVGERPVASAPPEIVPDAQAFEPPAASVPVGPPLPEPFQVQYLSAEGILLHFQAGDQQWTVMPRRALVFPQEEVACPLPFECQFAVSDMTGVCDLMLRGGTRIRSLGSDQDSRMGIEIDRGQVVLHRGTQHAGGAGATVRLKIRSGDWRLELLEPETLIGIEVMPLTPTAEGDTTGNTRCQGGLALVSGAARLTDRQTGEVVELRPDRGLLSFSQDPGLAFFLAPEPLPERPDWIVAGETIRSVITRRYAALYEKEFLVDQPISQSIRPVVKDRRPQLSELAVQTLSLAGELSGLVDGLSAPHEEARIAAIAGLQSWLPRDPAHDASLIEELSIRFSPVQAQSIRRLLWGYNEQASKNAYTSQELVDWLGHDEIAIRELASLHLRQLTGRSYDYRASDPVPKREVSIRRWREHIAEQGALVRP
jgi:hypothetical protein